TLRRGGSLQFPGSQNYRLDGGQLFTDRRVVDELHDPQHVRDGLVGKRLPKLGNQAVDVLRADLVQIHVRQPGARVDVPSQQGALVVGIGVRPWRAPPLGISFKGYLALAGFRDICASLNFGLALAIQDLRLPLARTNSLPNLFPLPLKDDVEDRSGLSLSFDNRHYFFTFLGAPRLLSQASTSERRNLGSRSEI